MITIRESLHLNSLTPIRLQSDVLSRKLAGNYRLLNYSVTARDLLHMALQKPEIYIGTEHNSMVCIERQNVWDNSVRLEMMNQFLNRILCIHTPRFTYQDEVYLTIILRKMGILDVKDFIRQAKILMRQSELTKRLAEQYFSKEEELGEIIEAAPGEKKLREIIEAAPGKEQSRELPRGPFLQDRIFRRLQTAEISRALYQMQKAYYDGHAVMPEYAFLVQQKQLADEIRIDRSRRQIYRQGNALFMQHYNRYEHIGTGIWNEKITEENFYRQISAAILTGVVRRLFHERIEKQEMREESWQDYTNVFYGSAADVFQRIQIDWREDTMADSRMPVYMEEMNLLYQDEADLLENLERFSAADLRMHTELVPNYILAFLENQNLMQQRAALESAAVFYMRNYGCDEWMGEEQEYFKILRMQEMNLLEYQADSVKLPEYLANSAKLPEYRADSVKLPEYRADSAKSLEFTESMGTSVMRILEKYDKQAVKLRHMESYHQERSDMTEDPKEQQKIDLEYLTQVNEHNVQMQQLISEHAPTPQAKRHMVINKEQAKQNMRKALEHPEAPPEEIYETPQAVWPRIPANIRYLLQLADESTRTLYEKVLGISAEEGTTLQQTRQTERIQQTRQTEWIQQTRQTEQIRQTRQTEQIRQKEQTAVQQLQRLLTEIGTTETRMQENGKESKKQLLSMEQIQTAQTAMQILKSEAELRNETGILEQGRLSLVHRPEAYAEEALLQEIRDALQLRNTTLQSQENSLQLRTQKNREENEYHNTNTVMTAYDIQKQLQETKRDILKENKSLITTLVQDNLTSQMKNISNRVYLDLEKKLASERKRRGY